MADKALIDSLFAEHKFDIVVNLAAQAGVRYSIETPDAYIQSNVIGFYNILEACRHAKELAQSSRAASDTAEKSTRFKPAPGQPQNVSSAGIYHDSARYTSIRRSLLQMLKIGQCPSI